MKKIAITMGDAAGIGPEIILKAINKINDLSDLLIIGNRNVFKRTENICNLFLPENIEFLDVPFYEKGIINATENEYSGELAFLCLKKACDLINEGKVSSVATAPISKNALNMAGYKFSGQTEILEEQLSDGNEKAQMLFVAKNLRVLLLTRHIALKNVYHYITENNIINTTKIFNNELINKFKISSPKIAMCSLNPHAGENGLLGDEEIKIINPAIEKLNTACINIEGAFSADTLIGKAVKNYSNPDYDGYIACYHDQALPAIKSLGLENVLNITIGLKALRVSPSHGTAFDIAYKNRANYGSMLNSINYLKALYPSHQ